MHHIARLVEGLVIQAADHQNFGIGADPAPESDQPMIVVDEYDVDVFVIDRGIASAQPDQIGIELEQVAARSVFQSLQILAVFQNFAVKEILFRSDFLAEQKHR